MTVERNFEDLELIREIIKDVEEDRTSLSTAMIKTLRIAEKNQQTELQQFVRNELEGAYTLETLPEYRTKHADILGIFRNNFTGQINSTKIDFEPLLKKSGEISDKLNRKHLYFSIPEIEDYLEKSKTSDIKIEFTLGQVNFVRQYLQDDEANGWILQTAYFQLPMSTFPQIIVLTKRRFIQLLLDIESLLHPSDAIGNEHFFENGKRFDAIVSISDVINNATEELILIDGYVDQKTLQLFCSKNSNIHLLILTSSKSMNDIRLHIDAFNAQYQNLEVRHSNAFHDRFIIVDRLRFYHIGASIKDLGKKSFMFSLIEDASIQELIMKKFSKEWGQ